MSLKHPDYHIISGVWFPLNRLGKNFVNPPTYLGMFILARSLNTVKNEDPTRYEYGEKASFFFIDH